MSDDSMQASVSFALTALKSLILVNGGGVLAILTFAGNASVSQGVLNHLADAVTSFVVGLIAALISNVLSYFAQESNSLGKVSVFEMFRWTAVLAAVASLGAFSCGAFTAAEALRIH